MTASEDVRRPVESVLPGLTVHGLEEGYSWEFAYVLLRLRDPDGDIAWSYRTSSPPNREELLGALQVQVDLLRKELLEEWA